MEDFVATINFENKYKLERVQAGIRSETEKT